MKKAFLTLILVSAFIIAAASAEPASVDEALNSVFMSGLAKAQPSGGSFSSLAGKDILFDNSSSSSASNTNTITFQHTIGSGDDRLLVVGTAIEDASSSDLVITGITYNGQPMLFANSSIVGASYFMGNEIWYILEDSLPSAGTYNVVVTASGTCTNFIAGSMSFSNVKQQAPESTAANNDGESGSSSINTSISIISEKSLVVDVIGSGNSITGFTSTGQEQQERWDTSAASSRGAASSRIVDSEGSSSMSWTTDSSSNRMSHAVAAFAPAEDIAGTDNSSDFNIQRGYTLIGSGNLTSTITSGTDYTAPSGPAFIRITGTRLTSMGSTSGGRQNSDDFTVYIENPSNLASSITFRRHGTSDNTRIAWEIIEYTGLENGTNEFRVRVAGTSSFSSSGLTVDTGTVSGVQDDNDIVVFITGQANPDTGSNDANTGMCTSEWLSASDTARFTRGESGSDETDVSYAVIEFTGSNWKIQRAEHSYSSAGSWETETISPLENISRAFLHTQHRAGSGMDGLDEQGDQAYIYDNSTLRFQLQSGAGTTGQYTVAWVIENTQNTGKAMKVQHISGSRARNTGSEEDTWYDSIAEVNSTSTASIIGENCISSGTGTFLPRGFNSVFLYSASSVENKRSDNGQEQLYRYSVVEWPTENRSVTDTEPPSVQILLPSKVSYNCSLNRTSRTSGGSISAQGDNPPDETMQEAFDDSNLTKWLDFAGSGGTGGNTIGSSWIIYSYGSGESYKIAQYSITSANDAPERDPKNWTLEGSNDNMSWTVVDTRSDQQFTSRFQERFYNVSAPGRYNSYKLNITGFWDSSTANSVQLAEIELYECYESGGDSFTLESDNFTISANVTDNSAVDEVYAGVLLPNNTLIIVQMQNSGGSIYTGQYTEGLEPKGDYLITIFAKDSSNNTNSTETAYARRVVPESKILDVVDSGLRYINYTSSVVENQSGILTVELEIENEKVRKILVEGYDETSHESIIRVEGSSNEKSYMFDSSYIVDVSQANLTSANITATASGYHLFKCTDVNLSSGKCNDDENYTQILTGMSPGQNYTIMLTKEDPIFGETIQGAANISDSHMYQQSPDSNYGGLATIRVGRGFFAGRNYRGAIWFNLSSIPENADIKSANVSLYFLNIPIFDSTGSRTHEIHKVQQNPSRDWKELEITWNNYTSSGSWTSGGGDFNSTATATATFSSSELNTWIKYNVTSDVQDFVKNQSENFGWIILDSDEGTGLTRRDYASSESTNESARPYIEITYEVPDTEPPNVSLVEPDNGYECGTNCIIKFECSASDDVIVENISLYITDPNNQSFSLNQTQAIGTQSGTARWNLNLPEGNYTWNCIAEDSSGNSAFASSNRSLRIKQCRALDDEYSTYSGYSEYLIPGTEEQLWWVFQELPDSPPSNSGTHSIITVTASLSKTTVYYDHWEDGYDFDPSSPNATADEIIVLEERGDYALFENSSIPVSPRGNNTYYDGGDRIFTAGGPVSVVKVSWPESVAATLSFSLEVYPLKASTDTYTIPVGVDLAQAPYNYPDFESVFLLVQALEDDTRVIIDDPNTTGIDLNVTLDMGETANLSGIYSGTTVNATGKLNVNFITGDSTETYEVRGYTAVPDNLWDTQYISPVGSFSGVDTQIYLYNPSDDPINLTVTYEDLNDTGIFIIPPKETRSYFNLTGNQVPEGSGVYLSGDSRFWGIGSIDVDSPNYDWGFSLVPFSALTRDYYLGWSPGSSNSPPAESGSPVFVTAEQSDTEIFVDFSPVDGVPDASYTLDRLVSQKIYDPDNDSTGMRIYTFDNKKYSVAWGEDPDTAGTGAPYLDLGYTVLPLPVEWLDVVLGIEKFAEPETISIGGNQTVNFTVVVSAQSYEVSNVDVYDSLPEFLSYVPGSAYVRFSNGSSFNGGSVEPAISGNNLTWDFNITLKTCEYFNVTFTANTSENITYGYHWNNAWASGERFNGSQIFTPIAQRFIYVPFFMIDKDSGIKNTFAGGYTNYTIELENIGNQTLTMINVTDNLPSGFTFANQTIEESNATRTSTQNPSTGSNNLFWGTWDLAPGGKIRIGFYADVSNAALGGTYDNNVIASSNQTGEIDDIGSISQDADTPAGKDPENDDDVTITAISDLEITKSGSPDPVRIGGKLSYTINVTNKGPSNTTYVVVNDFLPDEVSFDSSSPAPNSSIGNLYTWNLSMIESGSYAVITLNVTVNNNTFGFIENNATTYSDNDDSFPDDNNFIDQTRLLCAINGTVSDALGAPVSSTVELYNSTGFIIASDTEDYNFTVLCGYNYSFKALPSSGNFNSLTVNSIYVNEDIFEVVNLEDTPDDVDKPDSLDDVFYNWSEAVSWDVNDSLSYNSISINFTYTADVNVPYTYTCNGWDYEARNCTSYNWSLLGILPNGTNDYTGTFSPGDNMIGVDPRPELISYIIVYDVTGLDESERAGNGTFIGSFINLSRVNFTSGRSYRIETFINNTEPGTRGIILDPYFDNIPNELVLDTTGADSPNVTDINGGVTINPFTLINTTGSENSTYRITWDASGNNRVIEDLETGELVKLWYVVDYAGNESSLNNATFFGDAHLTDDILLQNEFNTTYDISKPEVLLNSPASGYSTNNTTIEFIWNASDSIDSELLCNLTINGAVNETNITSESGVLQNYTVSGFTDGFYTWSVVCVDDAGNTNTSDEWNFTVDTNGLFVVQNFPVEGYFTNVDSVNFNWTVTDNIDVLMNCSLFVDGGIVQADILSPNGTPSNFSVSGIASGNHNWSVECFDDSGNSAFSGTRNFTLDYDSPSIILIRPQPGTEFNQTNTTIITVNATDFSLIDTILANVSWDSTSEIVVLNPIGGNQYEGNFTSTILTGQYNIKIIANDSFGNVNDSIETSIIVNDITPPYIDAVEPINGSNYAQNTNVTITINVTDPYYDYVETVYANVSWGSGSEIITLTEINNTQLFTGYFTNTSEYGIYNITIFANDTSGNLNTGLTQFNIIEPDESINGISCTLTETPQVAESGEKILFQGDLSYTDGTPATTSNISYANITLYYINSTNNTMVTQSVMANLQEGVWYYNWDVGASENGNYMAVVKIKTNEVPPKYPACSALFTVSGRGIFEIEGVSPDLLNINETARLASEITLNGEAVPSSTLVNPVLFVKRINGTTQIYNLSSGLAVADGLIYLDGQFNETGVYYLNWTVEYYNRTKQVQEVVVAKDWDEKLRNITIGGELYTAITDNRDKLVEVLREMERQQEFSEEEIFLVTDAVNSMTRVANMLADGEITEAQAQEELDMINARLRHESGGSLTGRLAGIFPEDDRQTVSLWSLVIVLAFVILFIIVARRSGEPNSQYYKDRPRRRYEMLFSGIIRMFSRAGNRIKQRRYAPSRNAPLSRYFEKRETSERQRTVFDYVSARARQAENKKKNDFFAPKRRTRLAIIASNIKEKIQNSRLRSKNRQYDRIQEKTIKELSFRKAKPEEIFSSPKPEKKTRIALIWALFTKRIHDARAKKRAAKRMHIHNEKEGGKTVARMKASDLFNAMEKYREEEGVYNGTLKYGYKEQKFDEYENASRPYSVEESGAVVGLRNAITSVRESDLARKLGKAASGIPMPSLPKIDAGRRIRSLRSSVKRGAERSIIDISDIFAESARTANSRIKEISAKRKSESKSKLKHAKNKHKNPRTGKRRYQLLADKVMKNFSRRKKQDGHLSLLKDAVEKENIAERIVAVENSKSERENERIRFLAWNMGTHSSKPNPVIRKAFPSEKDDEGFQSMDSEISTSLKNRKQTLNKLKDAFK